MSWWVPLVAILGLIVTGVLVVIFAPVPRAKERAVGRHSWISDRDIDDEPGSDDGGQQGSGTKQPPGGDQDPETSQGQT